MQPERLTILLVAAGAGGVDGDAACERVEPSADPAVALGPGVRVLALAGLSPDEAGRWLAAAGGRVPVASGTEPSVVLRAARVLAGEEPRETVDVGVGHWAADRTGVRLDSVAAGLLGGPCERPLSVLSLADRVRLWRVAKPMMSGSAGSLTLDVRVGRNGVDRWVEVRGACASAGRLAGTLSDVTERKALEAALRLSEERLAPIIESGELGFFDVDWRTGRATYSVQWKRLLGYGPGEVEDTNDAFRALLHPVDRERLTGKSPRVPGRQREPFNEEFRMRHRDGTWRWISSSGLVFRDAAGEAVRAIGFHHDITARKAAEQMLARSESLYRTLVAHLPGGLVVLVDRQRTCVLLDGGAVAASGIQPEDHLGKPAEEMALAEQRPALARFWEEALAGRPAEAEFEIAGRQFAISGIGLPHSGPAGPAALAVAIDVTAERNAARAVQESEDRYRRATRAAQAGCWETVLPDDVTTLDENLAWAWGLPRFGIRFSEISGRIDPRDRAAVASAWVECAAGRSRQFSVEFRLLEAGEKWFAARAELIRDPRTGHPRLLSGTAIDITARREAERRLRESEALHRTLIRQLPNGVVAVLSRERRYMVVGGALLECLGLRPEDYVGRTPEEAVEPARREVVARSWDEALAGKANRHTLQVGGRALLMNAIPLHDETGRIFAALVIGIDVTDERIQRQRLEQDEERYRLLFASSPLPMWVHDRATRRFLAVNQAAVAAYGYSEEEFLTMYLEDVHAEDERPRLQRRLRSGPRGLQRGGMWRHVRKDGSEMVVEVTSTDMAAFGLQARVALIVDQTKRIAAEEELRSSEQRLRAILSEIPVGVVLYSRDGSVDFANRAARRLNQRVGRSLLNPGEGPAGLFLRSDGQPLVSANSPVRVARETGVPQHNVVVGFQRPRNEGVRWLRIDAIPLPGGRPAAVASSVLELTEQMEAEQRIRDSLADKEMLLQEVYHRVKNNLQIVTSLVNMQARQSAAVSGTDALLEFGRRVSAMSLVHEQLYQSRNLARIRLAEYARTLASNLVAGLAPAEGRVTVRVVEEDPVELGLGMAIPVGLILNELVANALKYAFPGERAGQLTVRVSSRPAAHVTVVVSDDGAGVGTELESAEGSLGMRIVKSLAKQLRGRISWTGRQGVTVTLQFPVPAT